MAALCERWEQKPWRLLPGWLKPLASRGEARDCNLGRKAYIPRYGPKHHYREIATVRGQMHGLVKACADIGTKWPFVLTGEMVRCASLLDHITVPFVSNPGRLTTRLCWDRRCSLTAVPRFRALGKAVSGDKPTRRNHRRRRCVMLIPCGFDALHRLSRRASLLGRDVPYLGQSV